MSSHNSLGMKRCGDNDTFGFNSIQLCVCVCSCDSVVYARAKNQNNDRSTEYLNVGASLWCRLLFLLLLFFDSFFSFSILLNQTLPYSVSLRLMSDIPFAVCLISFSVVVI